MEGKIKYFNFHYLVLGAKHWYVKNDDETMCEFVNRLVRLENRFCVGKVINAEEVAIRYCLMCLDELTDYYRANNRKAWWDNYTQFYANVRKKMFLYNVEQPEAIVLFVFEILFDLDPKVIDLVKPVYGKGYPRYSNRNGLTYTEMRKRADEVFG